MISLPGLDRAVAQDLIDTAHQVCPYSNATRGNIQIDLLLA
jgi:organic hydroperoxide reductase OsmC/OhrA